ncbi:unnamed protein product [Allacma fusca]|uniref:Uncharacterized protein n=1 Tax=Allacma fusca TaxID=39272 RepID=A0A8J2K5T0_9HEXA|nr:unnamed protein product [Allacma fusca]
MDFRSSTSAPLRWTALTDRQSPGSEEVLPFPEAEVICNTPLTMMPQFLVEVPYNQFGYGSFPCLRISSRQIVSFEFPSFESCYFRPVRLVQA